MNISEKEYRRLEREVTRLLKSLKQDIGDDYRASDDDTLPSMQVTIGASVESIDAVHQSTAPARLVWHYQTGDNSYSGGAYGHPNWGVISLYRRSNCAELAHDCVEQIAESIESTIA